MDMAFGAAQDSSSSFFVFAGSAGFERAEDKPVQMPDGVLDLGDIAQKPRTDSRFEQPCEDVPVGLVIEFSVPVDLPDLGFEGFQQGGLEVKKQERGENVGVAQIGQVGRKIGDLEERLEDKKAGFDAPTGGINL